jgi:hypothetical protein
MNEDAPTYYRGIIPPLLNPVLTLCFILQFGRPARLWRIQSATRGIY